MSGSVSCQGKKNIGTRGWLFSHGYIILVLGCCLLSKVGLCDNEVVITNADKGSVFLESPQVFIPQAGGTPINSDFFNYDATGIENTTSSDGRFIVSVGKYLTGGVNDPKALLIDLDNNNQITNIPIPDPTFVGYRVSARKVDGTIYKVAISNFLTGSSSADGIWDLDTQTKLISTSQLPQGFTLRDVAIAKVNGAPGVYFSYGRDIYTFQFSNPAATLAVHSSTTFITLGGHLENLAISEDGTQILA
ncbi:MAG TPA: hypothetical protein VD913_05160, partial [bacterium]|nr:hypothetical protein [bacterium]